MGIIVFLLVLTVLVVIHELGHFFMAWRFGVHIEEFGVGFPPKVLTLFKWRGVPFTLNAFPIGGFVRMEGENGEERTDKTSNIKIQNSKHATRHAPFYIKPAWQRLLIVIAGPAVNFVFGILAFTVIFLNVGIPTALPNPLISTVRDNSPAMLAGLRINDEILSVKDEVGQSEAIETSEEFSEFVRAHLGQKIVMTIEREGSTQEIVVQVRKEGDIPQGEGAIGIAMEGEKLMRYPWYQMPGRAAVVGVSQSLDFGKLILGSLRNMTADLFTKGTVPSDVAGPVGIAYEVQRGNLISYGPLAVLNFAAMLSVNLAIMNILPIPALDGGRAFFILIERLFERKLRAKLENHINTVGFVLLLVLIGLITIKDVIKIIQ